MLPSDEVINSKRNYFNHGVASSLTYLANAANLAEKEEIKLIGRGHWQVFSHYFLCIDALKAEDHQLAEKRLISAIKAATESPLVPVSHQHGPIINVITENEIDKPEAILLKTIYLNPGNDNDINETYSIDAFTGNREIELVNIRKALNIIKTVSAEHYNFLIALLDTVMIVGNNPDLTGIKSGSTLRALGCISISPGYNQGFSALGQYIEDLIHEASHTYLFLEQSSDELVKNPVTALYSAPFRDDKRPMVGIFHSNYVLGNLIGYFAKAACDKSAEPAMKNENFLNRSINRFNETTSIIKHEGELTELGRKIFLETKQQVNAALATRN